jgi:hypothetical protein
MSTIAAGTSSGTALVSTGNTDGTLQLQVNGTTPSVTLATTGAIGVGSTPGYGTSGQVLTSAGSGAAPTWTTPSSGAMTFITSVTASNSATVDVENAMTAYDVYMIVADQIITTSGANPSFALRLKVGGTYQTGASYQYHSSTLTATNSAYSSVVGNGVGNIQITSSLRAGGPVSFVLYLFKPSNATTYKIVSWQGGCANSAPTTESNVGTGIWFGSTDAITGVRFYTSTNNIVSGTFRLYGISNS